MKSPVHSGIVLQYNTPTGRGDEVEQQAGILLVRNVEEALRKAGVPFTEVRNQGGRIVVETKNTSDAARVAARVFGVDSVSNATVACADMNQDLRISEALKGVGGLPTGIESKVVCTISSGLDSPVASYKVMRRGCVPVFVHFDNAPFSDESNKELAIRQAKRLAEYVHGFEVKMYIVPHGDDLVEVLKHGPRKMTCVLCRRNMYRLAQEIALREGADAIVTGEIIGEQASQTTQNLRAERDAICEIPILRPCIGDDKVEIEALARTIGTYEFASEAVSCCSLPPKYPAVRARPEDVREAEEKMDMDWISAEVSQAEVIILKDGPKK
ncbi:MAG: tRNA sulfurtransferase [Candidatus Thorarchaeota archaeon]